MPMPRLLAPSPVRGRASPAMPIGQPRFRLRQLGVLPFQHVRQITHDPLQQDGVVRQAGKVTCATS